MIREHLPASPSREKLLRRLSRYEGIPHIHSVTSTHPKLTYAESIYTVREISAYFENLLPHTECSFVSISDHPTPPGNPRVVANQDPEAIQLKRQAAHITRLNQEMPERQAVVFSGAEMSLIYNPETRSYTCELPNETMAKLDLVIASRHGGMPPEVEKEPRMIEASLVTATQNPHVAAIGHPDRYAKIQPEELQSRSPKFTQWFASQWDNYEQYTQDYYETWERILETMEEADVLFEINLNSPPDDHLLAMAAACESLSFTISFDAHDFGQFQHAADARVTEGEAQQDAWAGGDAQPEEIDTLAAAKKERLAGNPGPKPILRLIRFDQKLEQLLCGPLPEDASEAERAKRDNIMRSRVLNTRERLLALLVKKRGSGSADGTGLTENLRFLSEKEI